MQHEGRCVRNDRVGLPLVNRHNIVALDFSGKPPGMEAFFQHDEAPEV